MPANSSTVLHQEKQREEEKKARDKEISEKVARYASPLALLDITLQVATFICSHPASNEQGTCPHGCAALRAVRAKNASSRQT
jgi:hypothetical protein